MAFTIPSGIYGHFNDLMDSFFAATGPALNCILVYPAAKTACPNCKTNTMMGVSTSRYKSGGPIPFTDGQICPLCEGAGYKSVSQTETVRTLVYWNPKSWLDIGIKIDIPDGIIQIKGLMADLHKYKQAEELHVHSAIQNEGLFRYTRHGEQLPTGFKGDRYFIGYWKRIG